MIMDQTNLFSSAQAITATAPSTNLIDLGATEDQLMELALEAGAEDFKAEAEGYEILTEPGQFEAVHKQLEAKGIKPAVAEVTELPSVTVPLEGEPKIAAVSKLIDALEDHDDVKEVYSNANFPD